MLNPGGTSLTEYALAQGEVLVSAWQVKADYQWDTGVAVGKVLAGLKEGKIVGVRCESCQRTMVPPRAFCELCFVPLDSWITLSDVGTVNTFSVSYVNWDATRREKPEVPAVIEINGASSEMGILHLLGEVGDNLETILGNVRIGIEVEAVWKPAVEREGAITDIRYFRPVK